MKLKKLEITGLLGKDEVIDVNFNDDINILTGRNGSGKTSVLKLVWYIISGNILLALREVIFSKVTIVTSEYECTIYKLSRSTCKIELTRDGEKRIFEDILDHDGDAVFNAEDEVDEILQDKGNSVFLPTFRRIEGGFSLGNSSGLLNRINQAKNEVEDALLTLSKKLTNKSHVFVSSISTSDISTLLLRKYSDLSDIYTEVQQTTSQDIINTIKEFKSDREDVTRIQVANKIIDEIRSKIESMETKREEVMMPIEGVRGMVSLLFKHSGIKFNNRLNFGDAAKAISSDALSAGEKQMLSFICYNAFYKDSIIFIDEPELSLHVDWQRQLFSILCKQNSSNQFIIATHSPFIYAKYPDKEIVIDSDRGDLDN